MPNFKTKEERNAWYRMYRAERKEHFREYNKKYNSEWRKKNGYAAEETWKLKNPEKVFAQQKLHTAVRSRRVRRLPCEVCKDKKSVAHHPNYSKPLVIVWLCKIHHREKHYTSNRPKMSKKELAILKKKWEERKRYILRKTAEAEKRNFIIFSERMKGRTLDSIGKEFGITRERVRQILKSG